VTEAPRDTTNGKVGERAALDSVRHLEETLKGQRELREAAQERIEAAREEAARIVREAHEEALRTARERRSERLAGADEEAERLVGEARERCERLLALVEEDRSAAADWVLGWLVPGEES
jgi:vacuolar-type H+-ATPase subunit H